MTRLLTANTLLNLALGYEGAVSHLFLEEILPVFQGSQSVLLDLMLQVFTRGLEVANEIL